MKHSWIIIIAAIIIAVLLGFLLQGDKQHDTHKDDKADVVADHDTLKAHGVDYARVNDSLAKEIARLKGENKSLVSGQANTQRKLDAKTAEVRTLVAQIREINQDTAYKGHVFDDGRLEIPTKYSIRDKIVNLLLDSLEQQVKSLQFLIVQYEQYADSINNVNDSLQAGHEATKKADDKRIAELQSAYDNLYKVYMTLFKTSADLQKDLKRQKLKTKIAGVLGAAAAVLAIIK